MTKLRQLNQGSHFSVGGTLYVVTTAGMDDMNRVTVCDVFAGIITKLALDTDVERASINAWDLE